MQEFVQKEDGGGGSGGTTQVQVPKLSWAEECVDDDDDRPQPIIELPTAPRATRLMNDEMVTRNPPFVAYMSNLPFELEEEDIHIFFENYQLLMVRLPRDDDGNKTRGYAYVEFEAREDLIDALAIAGKSFKIRDNW